MASTVAVGNHVWLHVGQILSQGGQTWHATVGFGRVALCVDAAISGWCPSSPVATGGTWPSLGQIGQLDHVAPFKKK